MVPTGRRQKPHSEVKINLFETKFGERLTKRSSRLAASVVRFDAVRLWGYVKSMG